MESINEFKRFWRKHDEISGKNILIRSLSTQIYQRFDVKLGTLLSLIGGVP
jgi:DNA replicative helicase MCM subunit Mcm2 (Cdc46/Mcm family)